MSVQQQIAPKQDDHVAVSFCILCYLTLRAPNVFILHSRIGFMIIEGGTDRLSRNVAKELLPLAGQ